MVKFIIRFIKRRDISVSSLEILGWVFLVFLRVFNLDQVQVSRKDDATYQQADGLTV